MNIGQERFKEINEILNRKLKDKKSLIAVHRGSPGGNIIENTIPAYKISLDMGADMFEMDVISSTDGVLYTFHDGTELRNFRIEKNIKTLSSKEIDSLNYYNSSGVICNYKAESFEDVVKTFQQGELYNIDRAWDIFPQVIEILNKYPNAIKQALLKAPAKKEILDFLEQCPDKYMFMPIAYTWEDIQEVMSYKNINTVGIELIARDEENELFSDETIKKLKSMGLFVWANAITLDDEIVLFAHLDDNLSLIEGPEKGWGKLFDKEIDIIQTDWPALLYRYREEYFS